MIEAQFLRCHFRGLWEIIYAPELGVALCREGAHDPVTRHSDYIFLDELPARCVEFAEAHGIRWRLERECPSLHADPPLHRA